MEKVSELIKKGKLRLCQLAGIDLEEILVPFTNVEINKLWEGNHAWQRAFSNFLWEINNYHKSERIWVIMRINWILPCTNYMGYTNSWSPYSLCWCTKFRKGRLQIWNFSINWKKTLLNLFKMKNRMLFSWY